jgi:hypothetical protein
MDVVTGAGWTKEKSTAAMQRNAWLWGNRSTIRPPKATLLDMAMAWVKLAERAEEVSKLLASQEP